MLELLKVIEGLTIPVGVILVAIDIETLYSSIPHERGIEVVAGFLCEQDRNNWKLCNFVISLLRHILTSNVFLFNGSTYLQVQGDAMGTCANLYLGGWERSLFSNDGASTYLCHILLWRRYIDNVLVIWTGTSSERSEFMAFLSVNQFNLKFMQSDTQSIPFLDLRLFMNPDESVYSTLYRKETVGNTILHYSSAHPHSLIHRTPFSRYLRLRRNCAREEDF